MSEKHSVVRKSKITTRVNGKDYECEVEPRLLLVDLLRDELELTGTHVGCDTSNCGACTVIMDGRTIKSCTCFAAAADGREIVTVESLAGDGRLHPLQQAFWENHGLQCGYCTPGVLMSALYLLSRNPDPTEEEIRRGIAGNLCRCTGYQLIVESIKDAAKKMRERAK
ncbi:MAG: (2Fe-2S)-binding protein [Acidobacteria bacterium]|nr:(2Fe-2S)-binding protein [Acidobacteriota bacterium]